MMGKHVLLLFSSVYLAVSEANYSSKSGTEKKVIPCLIPSTFYEQLKQGTNGSYGVVMKKFEVITATKLSWTEALLFCKERRADLATIKNKQENDAVVDLLNKTSLCTGIDVENFWIGGTELGSPRGYFWTTTGYPVYTYDNWHEGEPDNWRGIEHCMAYSYNPTVYGSKFIKWNDVDCATKSYFVCQYLF